MNQSQYHRAIVTVVVFFIALLLAILCSAEARAATPFDQVAKVAGEKITDHRSPSVTTAPRQSPVCPAQRCAPAAASFSVQRSALSVKSSALRAANPATARSRRHSGPGLLVVFPSVKQYADIWTATLPAVAGSIFA
jgi:hypothetical protein